MPATATGAPAGSTSPPASCEGGWSGAYGPPLPAVAAAAQAAMEDAALEGEVVVGTYGENDGCGRFHAMSVDFTFTLNVDDLSDQARMATLAQQLQPIVDEAMQHTSVPNPGTLTIRFRTSTQECYWRADNPTCVPLPRATP